MKDGMGKLVVANWKMNPATYGRAEGLVKHVLKYGKEDVVLCPPFPYLFMFRNSISKQKLGFGAFQFGAQDVFYEKEGAYTGEVSAQMLKDVKVKYVIVGHSERRALGDTDEIVAKKLRAVLDGGMTPILCVGERERKKLKVESYELKAEKKFVREQLEAGLTGVLSPSRRGQDDDKLRLIVAYEPVWAISSHSGGVSDTPESAGEMIEHIRDVLNSKFQIPNSKILYGGSVNAKNARGFLERPEIDGVLVGSASLRATEFRKIVEIARKT